MICRELELLAVFTFFILIIKIPFFPCDLGMLASLPACSFLSILHLGIMGNEINKIKVEYFLISGCYISSERQSFSKNEIKQGEIKMSYDSRTQIASFQASIERGEEEIIFNVQCEKIENVDFNDVLIGWKMELQFPVVIQGKDGIEYAALSEKEIDSIEMEACDIVEKYENEEKDYKEAEAEEAHDRQREQDREWQEDLDAQESQDQENREI